MSKARNAEAEVLLEGWSSNDVRWTDAWDRVPSLSGFTAEQVRIYQLGHYRGWSQASQPAQEKTIETKELSEYGKELWMKEYDRCRNSGTAVRISCKVADEAVREISQRIGKQDNAATSGTVELAADVYRWDGKQLYVLVSHGWEFAAQVWPDGNWMTYRPSDDSDDSGRMDMQGVVNRDVSSSVDVVLGMARLAVLRVLDWEAYGLKSPVTK